MFRGLFLTLLAVSIGLSGSCMLNGESSTYAIEDGLYTFNGVFTCGQTPADLLNTSSKFGEKYGEKDVPNVLEMMSAIIELYCCEKTEFGQKIAAAYLKDEKLEVDTPVRSYTLSRNDAKESDKLVVEDDKVEEVVEQPEVKMPQQAAYLYPQLPKTSAVGFPELSLGQLINTTTNFTTVKSNISAAVDDWYTRPMEIENGMNITGFVDFFADPIEQGTKIAKILITIVGAGFIGLEAVVFMLMALVMLIPVPEEEEQRQIREARNAVPRAPLRRSNRVVRPRAYSELVAAVKAKRELATVVETPEPIDVVKAEEPIVAAAAKVEEPSVKVEELAAVQESQVKVETLARVPELEEIGDVKTAVPSQIPVPVVKGHRKSKEITIRRPRRMSLRKTCITLERSQVINTEVGTLPKIEESNSEVDVNMDDVSSSKA